MNCCLFYNNDFKVFFLLLMLRRCVPLTPFKIALHSANALCSFLQVFAALQGTSSAAAELSTTGTDLAPTTSIADLLQRSNARSVSIRDLIKWCQRSNDRLARRSTAAVSLVDARDDVFRDAMDCFAGALSEGTPARSRIASLIGAKLGLASDRVCPLVSLLLSQPFWCRCIGWVVQPLVQARFCGRCRRSSHCQRAQRARWTRGVAQKPFQTSGIDPRLGRIRVDRRSVASTGTIGCLCGAKRTGKSFPICLWPYNLPFFFLVSARHCWLVKLEPEKLVQYNTWRIRLANRWLS